MSRSIVSGKPGRTHAGLDHPFTTARPDRDATKRRDAALTCAELAIAAGAETDLVDVLGALGLRDAS